MPQQPKIDFQPTAPQIDFQEAAPPPTQPPPPQESGFERFARTVIGMTPAGAMGLPPGTWEEGPQAALIHMKNLLSGPLAVGEQIPEAAKFWGQKMQAAMSPQTAAQVGPQTWHELGTIKPELGGIAAGAAAPFLAHGIAGKISPLITRPGPLFEAAAQKAGSIPIETPAIEAQAIKMDTLAKRGASLPKVVSDFINRVTDPQGGPITYNEARDFYSNATRLSSEESQRMTPRTKMELGKFTNTLGEAISTAAAKGGALEQYQTGMRAYAAQSRAGRIAEALKPLLIGGLGGAGIYQLEQALRKR